LHFPLQIATNLQMTNETQPVMPAPPRPTFYQLQAQAYVADLGGIMDGLEQEGSIASAVEAGKVAGVAAIAAALLDVAHAIRQVGATLATGGQKESRLLL
jgi:hypothetical protein